MRLLTSLFPILLLLLTSPPATPILTRRRAALVLPHPLPVLSSDPPYPQEPQDIPHDTSNTDTSLIADPIILADLIVQHLTYDHIEPRIAALTRHVSSAVAAGVRVLIHGDGAPDLDLSVLRGQIAGGVEARLADALPLLFHAHMSHHMLHPITFALLRERCPDLTLACLLNNAESIHVELMDRVETELGAATVRVLRVEVPKLVEQTRGRAERVVKGFGKDLKVVMKGWKGKDIDGDVGGIDKEEGVRILSDLAVVACVGR